MSSLSQFIIYLYSSKVEVDNWMKIFSYLVLSYGVVEVLTFTFLFLLMPFHMLRNGGVSIVIRISIFIIIFIYIRLAYIPLFLSLIPDFNYQFPYFIKEQSFYILAICYFLFGLVPCFFAFFELLFSIKGDLVTKTIDCSEKVFIVLPVYNEDYSDLEKTIKSIISNTYNNKIVYCVFDDFEISELYSKIVLNFVGNIKFSNTVNSCVINGTTIHFIRTHHGGKRNAQLVAYSMIIRDQDYKDSFTLLIDSDMVLKEDAIDQMIYYIQKHNKAAITGTIGITWFDNVYRNFGLLRNYQMAEYIQGQVIVRSVESLLSATCCLPGAFTMIRTNNFIGVAEKYFYNNDTKHILDYYRNELGEDRKLTHLLMKDNDAYAIGYCQDAFATTTAVTDYKKFLKQRTRWFKGAISNESFMIISKDLWRKNWPLLFYKVMEFSNRFMTCYSIVYLLYYMLGYVKSDLLVVLLQYHCFFNIVLSLSILLDLVYYQRL